MPKESRNLEELAAVISLAPNPNSKWVERWSVPSHSNPKKDPYVVARTAEGEWGCSCPHWKFRRKICRHIREVVAELERPEHTHTLRREAVQQPAGGGAFSIDEISRASLIDL